MSHRSLEPGEIAPRTAPFVGRRSLASGGIVPSTASLLGREGPPGSFVPLPSANQAAPVQTADRWLGPIQTAGEGRELLAGALLRSRLRQRFSESREEARAALSDFSQEIARGLARIMIQEALASTFESLGRRTLRDWGRTAPTRPAGVAAAWASTRAAVAASKASARATHRACSRRRWSGAWALLRTLPRHPSAAISVIAAASGLIDPLAPRRRPR